VKGASATIADLGGPASPMFDVIHEREPEAGMQAYLVNAISDEVSRTRNPEVGISGRSEVRSGHGRSGLGKSKGAPDLLWVLPLLTCGYSGRRALFQPVTGF